MPSVQLLRQESSKIRQRREQCDSHVALPGQPLQNARQPKRYSVASRRRAEVTQRQQDDVALRKCLPDCVRTNCLLRSLFLFQLAVNPVARPPEASRLPRPIRQIENRNHAKDDCRNSFQNKKPSPASHSQPRNSQQQTSERRANHIRERTGRIKNRDRFGAILISEPVGHVNNNGGKEACFRGATKKRAK